MHGTVPAYLSDSLQPTSEVVAHRYLHSADTTTLQVPSTRWATLGNRAFPVAAARAWNSLPLETRACSSLLTFRTPEGDQVSPLSSVIWLTWRRLLRWSADVCIELCNSFISRFCKLPPQLCDSSTLIHDICSSSSSRGILATINVTYGPRSFAVSGPSVWNKLPATLRVSPTLGQFQSKLKAVLFCSAYET